MPLEELVDRLERAGQVLFVAIEIGQNVALRAAVPAIDGVVHPVVLFNEGLDPLVVRQPVQGAVVGTGVLDDVLELDAFLVGDGSDAQFQPFGVSEAGSDD